MPRSKTCNFAIPRAALALWYFTNKAQEKNLYAALQNILIEPELVKNVRTAHAIATDGHRLMHVWWPLKKKDKLPESRTLSGFAVEKHLKSHGSGPILSRGAGHQYQISGPPKKTVLSGSGKATEVTGTVLADKYPQWRHIVPIRDDFESPYPQIYGVNLNYLNDFGKYLKEFNGDQPQYPGIKINYTNPPYGPILIIPTWDGGPGEIEIEYALKVGEGASAECVLMSMNL